MATINSIGSNKPVEVAFGGTGAATLTDHGVLVGSGTGAVTVAAVGTDGQVLIGGTTADPAFATITSSGGTITFTPGTNTLNMEAVGGLSTINADTGSATPAAGAFTIAGGTNLGTTGAGSTITVNMDLALSGLTSIDMADGGQLNFAGATGNIQMSNTGEVRTDTNAGNTMYFKAYDTDAPGWVTFMTFTANNTPTCDLSTAVTMGSNAIYYATGTDVPVTDGGTGASSLTDHGVLVGSGTAAVTALSVGTNGQVLVGSTGADPVFATLASADSTIEYTTGAGTLDLSVTGTVAINAQTGTSYTLVLADRGKLVTCSNAASITLTVPPNSSVAFDTGTNIMVSQKGAGTVTFAEGSGVTINSRGGLLDTAGQYAMTTLTKVDTNEWYLSGDIA